MREPPFTTRKEGLQTAGESPVLVYPFRSPLRARNVYGTYFRLPCSEPSRGGAGGRNARRRPFASTAERRVGDGVEVHGREQSHVSKGGL